MHSATISSGAIRCAATIALCLAPVGIASAQSGKWVASVQQLKTGPGAADLSIDPRNDKQSRAKISFRNTQRDMRIAWDIAPGRCGDNASGIASQATFTVVITQMDGSGSATANIPKLESGKLYYLRVFDPQSQPTDGVGSAGCANLSEKP
ncbi:MAG TPA: hypothetical protein VE869_15665 [Gemmatimonas sp.]|nr:hypothetical protein [Gemmatimonas sp.]